jgi:hypothetical protein
MRRTKQETAVLAERLCRPQRIGVFGYRGVGKTTLLTMLYREGVSGRLADLRLAAADARTADYLGDKIRELEAGHRLPATLAETDLRFHLYHGNSRQELLVKDYQGEHLALGRQDSIQQFLADCDALWLCLDVMALSDAALRLRRQQECEQLIEAYLSKEPTPRLERPVALLLTKSDLLEPERADPREWVKNELALVYHALSAHCPGNSLFAVSSLGGERGIAETLATPPTLQPRNLAEPLAWLAQALQDQDEARLERLWTLAGRDVARLERCVACVVHRYPESPMVAANRQRLRQVRGQTLRRRTLIGATAAACLVALLGSYDALGHQKAKRFEREHAGDPVATLEEWQRYRAWHPTRHLFQPGTTQTEDQHLSDLSQQARQFQRDRQLAELRRRAQDPDADPEITWQQFQELRADYPEVTESDSPNSLRRSLKIRRDEQLHHRAQLAFDQLTRAEHDGTDLVVLVIQADQFLRNYADTTVESQVRARRAAYLRRLEERDLEVARNYSGRQPFNFQTRREHYQRYLDKYPSGAFVAEAAAALGAIEKDWDKHDFRAIRDRFLTQPGDIAALVARCRAYLSVHAKGEFTSPASELLRWSERVTAPEEYRVVLRSGHFEKRIARFFSLGPDLSVELEVAGVRYGPSNIVVNRYDPEWNYEFPRRIRWKLGDPVRIRVTDHDYWSRVVLDIGFDENDPLAMRFLTGEVWAGKNRLTFESDFRLPTLPKIE